MKTCALAPLNKADTFFGGNGGASSSQKCHHNYYTAAAAAVQFSKMREKRREIRGCPEKNTTKIEFKFFGIQIGLGNKE